MRVVYNQMGISRIKSFLCDELDRKITGKILEEGAVPDGFPLPASSLGAIPIYEEQPKQVDGYNGLPKGQEVSRHPSEEVRHHPLLTDSP